MTDPYFAMIPLWVARLQLHGAEHRVLLVIASHANKVTRIAYVKIERIVEKADLDRRNVQRAIRRLEASGVLKRLRGGGRLHGSRAGNHVGRSSEYQIIFTRPTDDTANSVDNAAIPGQETAAFSDLNSVARAAPTESEQKDTPPSGESHRRSRAETAPSNAGVEETQGILPPTQGAGDRMAPVRRYNPSTALVDWAKEQYGINALDDAVLGQFIDWHVEHQVLPGNGSFEAVERGYRRWIRREALFAKQPRHGPQHHGTADEAESVVEAFRQMRAMRANGAGHD